RPGSSIEEATYIPPEPDRLGTLLDNWEKYYHAERPDPLVQLAKVHGQFEIIHPFVDGNGRIGRILIPLFLFEKGLLSRPVFRSERESDRVGILRGFHDSANGEEFEVTGRQSLGLEQQVTQILVAAPAIDEHPDVPIHGFYYTHADLGSTVVRDALQVLQ